LINQEIKYRFCKSKDKYPRTEFTSVIDPTVRFNINVPTVLGDFLINRHVQDGWENLNVSNIRRNMNDPRYFPHNPSLDDWYKGKKREPDYVIDTYTALRLLEITTGVRRGSWRNRNTTFYQHQQITTETNCNSKICGTEDHTVGRVHKYLIDEAVKRRKRRKVSATRYIQESFNPVLNP
jgi:hypothetical protein